MTKLPPTALIPLWQERYPERWRRELDALDATGWEYSVVGDGSGLLVSYPLGPGDAFKILVEFGPTYPFFGAEFVTVNDSLAPTQKTQANGEPLRHSFGGTLCLLHGADRHMDDLVADILATQLPKLLEANQSGVDDRRLRELEAPFPEPVSKALHTFWPAIVVTDAAVPPGEQGALICRFGVNTDETLGAGLVETILGPDIRINSDVTPSVRHDLPLVLAGRWIRDPAFTPEATPRRTWERIEPLLAPLEATVEDLGHIEPTKIEVIGLLVPEEVGYREQGESWVFLIRTRHHETDGWSVHYRESQQLSRQLLAERTPITARLPRRSVVVVGLGSLGMPIVQDLAMTGIGYLFCVDGDIADVGTGTRQLAPLHRAGFTKASMAVDLALHSSPYAQAIGIPMSVQHAYQPQLSEFGELMAATTRKTLAKADLVIDATGELTVTRFLAAVRDRVGKPLLHVSSTAGAWGGVVALVGASGKSGALCWACIEHARAERSLPVPPADEADGWVVPPRCFEQTFRGTRASLQQIASHASAVATNYLAGEPSMGSYFVASLRTPDGAPTPISWTTAEVPIHPSCPLHRSPANTAPGGEENPVPDQTGAT